jgi:hypothetical protein
MKFAYADPPYPGQSEPLYGDHPDYGGEVDHAELIGQLCAGYPDGWALSTSAQALREVLPMCPADAWVAAWHKTNAPPIRTTGRFIWSWEPVIVSGGRRKRGTLPDVRDALSAAMPASRTKKIPGQKPEVFTRWIAALLGATPDDMIVDLFTGSGAVGSVLAKLAIQPELQLSFDGQTSRAHRHHRGRGL